MWHLDLKKKSVGSKQSTHKCNENIYKSWMTCRKNIGWPCKSFYNTILKNQKTVPCVESITILRSKLQRVQNDVGSVDLNRNVQLKVSSKCTVISSTYINCCIVSWCVWHYVTDSFILWKICAVAAVIMCVFQLDTKKVVCSQGPKGWRDTNINSLNLHLPGRFKKVPKKRCTQEYSSSVNSCIYPGQVCDSLFSSSGSPKCLTHSTVTVCFPAEREKNKSCEHTHQVTLCRLLGSTENVGLRSELKND